MIDRRELYTSAIEEIRVYLHAAQIGPRRLLDNATFCVRRLPSLHPAASAYSAVSMPEATQLLPQITLEHQAARNVAEIRYINWQKLLLLERTTDFNVMLLALDHVIERYPDDAWLRLARARALWGVQHFPAALEDCIQAGKHLNNAEVHLLQGEIQYFLENYWESLSQLSVALVHEPRLARALISRAMTRCELAKREKQASLRQNLEFNAQKDLDQAKKLRPDLLATIERIRHTYLTHTPPDQEE